MARSQAKRIRLANGGHGHCRKRTWLLSLSAIPALVACPAEAAKWEIHPTLSTDVTYTDNVSLARPGLERSDWVTQVTPGVSINATGAGLKVNATYAAQFLNRAETGGNGINHLFKGAANAELVRQLFFIDARGSVSQQNVSLLAPQADSNVNNTGNRVSVSSFFISPYLRYSFGQDAQGEARFTHSTVSTSSVAGGGTVAGASSIDSQNNSIDLRLTSGPAFKVYNWSVAYSRSTLDYSRVQQPNVTTETISAGGRRLITSQFGLTSTIGYEKSDYTALRTSPSGSFWNAGFDWTPTPRTRLAVTTGRRYFGSTKSLDFSHRTRLTTWGANYSENVTTTHGQALVPSSASTASYLDTLFLSHVPDPVARQAAVQSFITQNALPASLTVPVNFLTTQTILTKQLNGTFGINGARNTVLTNFFTRTSESLAAGVAAVGAGDFASSSTVRQTGGSVLWNWRIARNLSSTASASYTHSELPALGRKDNLQTVRLGLAHEFQPHLSGTLNYRGTRSDSTTSGAGYSENAISASLSLRY